MSSRDIPKPPEIRRLLIVRLGAMGDVIHALPAAALLRRALPQARLVWAVEPSWKPLLEDNPDLDAVIELPLKRLRREPGLRSWAEVRAALAALRDEQFDAAIDFQGLVKSALTARWSGAGTVIGFSASLLRERAAAWFYHVQIAANRSHVVDQNLALVRKVADCSGGETHSARFPLPAGEVSPALPQRPFVLASPAAGWKFKQWPAERYARLAARLWRERETPLVLDGPERDRALLETIQRMAPPGACRVHVSSIPELIGATRRARAVVGVDSGPMHLAAALGKPGVALFGPTDPKRNGPYGDSLAVIRTAGAATTYQRLNRWSEAMSAITEDRVWDSLSEALDRDGPPLEVVAGPEEDRS